MQVKLLDVTANAKELIYAAGRQCYKEGWVGDSWKEKDGVVTIVDYDNKVSTNKEILALIKHLVQSGHTSVLEHVKFTFAISDVSRSLTHQHVRHRISSYSQQSQRYVSNGGKFDINDYVIPPSIQNNENMLSPYKNCLELIQTIYNLLEKNGIPAEDARYLLPNASKTRIVDTKNCVSLLHFFNLRCCELAQWEIRKLAYKMLYLCQDVLPVVFEDAGANCKKFGYCPEDKTRSCGKFPTRKEVLEGYEAWKESLQAMKENSN